MAVFHRLKGSFLSFSDGFSYDCVIREWDEYSSVHWSCKNCKIISTVCIRDFSKSFLSYSFPKKFKFLVMGLGCDVGQVNAWAFVRKVPGLLVYLNCGSEGSWWNVTRWFSKGWLHKKVLWIREQLFSAMQLFPLNFKLSNTLWFLKHTKQSKVQN